MIKPLNCIQWFDLVLVAAYPSGDVDQLLSFDNRMNRKDVGKRLVKTFESLLAGYDSKVNVEGIVVGASHVPQSITFIHILLSYFKSFENPFTASHQGQQETTCEKDS